MNYDLNEEQKMLQESAHRFMAEACPSTYVRAMVEDEKGYAPEVWEKMVELGWLGLPFPEEFGGYGMDFLHLAVLLMEMGYFCMPGPFFSTVVLGGLTVLEAGNEEQKREILSPVAEGKRLLSLAWIEEDGNCFPERMAVSARADGDGYVLSGTKLFVPDAHVADTIVCAAAVGEGDDQIGLFLVDAGSPGLSVHPLATMAGDKSCEVVFDGVKVGAGSLLGSPGEGGEVLRSVLLKAAVAKCAEMSGGARRALELAVTHAKERIQFGRPIGAFQAVQHHCANMLTYADTIRFLAYHAAWKIGTNQPFERDAAVCKAWVSESYRKLVSLAHQVLGGMGFMKEHDMHLYFLRAKTAEVMFGGPDYHREVVARALGL